MKTVLITGAARGIGLATARKFLAEGWRVAALDRLRDPLRDAVAGLASNDVVAVEADVSDPDAVKRAIDETVAAFGRLDALVNNAGVADFGLIEHTGFDVWREIMATNLDGPFLMTQAATPLLSLHGGAVVNVSSISGLRASTLRVAYGVSKAGVNQLTKQQAVELGESGIRVNAVAPGPVETAMAAKVHTPAIRKAYRDAIPLARYGDEAEIASAIFFLCSDEASYITGQVIAADGGFEATGVGLPALREGKP